MGTAAADITRLEVWTGDTLAERPALAGSIRVNLDMSGRSTARWSMRIADASTAPDTGDAVEIRGVREGVSTVLFVGAVERVKMSLAGDLRDGPARAEYTAADTKRQAERFLVTDRYEGMSMREIVESITNDYLGDIGVTLGASDDGPTIDVISWQYVSAARAIEEVVQLGGYNWRISPAKEILIFAKTDTPSAWSATPSGRPWQSISIERDILEYRDVQYVRGGDGVLNRTETFVFDGQNTTFTLGLPVADDSQNPPSISIGANDAQDAGLPGIDSTDWYYRPGENQIYRDEDAADLTDGDILTIEYNGIYPVLVRRQRAGSTPQQYELLSNEPTLDNDVAAEKYAEELLDRYGQPAITIEIATMETGLQIGQDVLLDEPGIGVQGAYLVERISITDDGVVGATWRASLVDTTAGRWREFWTGTRRLAENIAIREGEVIHLIISISDTQAMADTPAALDASNVGLVGSATVGTSLIGN